MMYLRYVNDDLNDLDLSALRCWSLMKRENHQRSSMGLI